MNEIYQSGLSGDRVMELLRRQFVVPTLSSAPTTNTLRWVDDMGYTNTFRVGELCRVAIDDGYTFYILKDLKDGVATWELMGSGGGEGDTDLTPVYNLIKTKLDNSYFRRIFSPLDANGNEIAPNDTTTPIASVRVNYGLWTEQFLSAKGMNSGGGSDEPTGGATTLGGLRNVANAADSTYDVAKMLVLEAKSNLWTLKNLSDLVGGLDEAELAEYLTNNNYAKKGDIPSLSGYATEQWVLGKGYATTSDLDNRIDALVNGAPAAYDTLKEIADVLANNINSIDDILTALGTKVSKDDFNTAIANVNTAIDSLNTELGLKLDAVTFNELFEKVQLEDGTWAIKAKLGLFSDGFISAKGSNVGGTSSEGGAVALYQLNDVLADGTQVSGAQHGAVFVYDTTIGKWKGVAQSEIVPNLKGYATESWVLSQGFLTEHQDLSDYAKLTDIPTIPTTDINKGVTAYGWGDHSKVGYLIASSLDGYVNDIATEGNGNAITSVSKNGKKLTFTKGATYLTGITSKLVTDALGFTPFDEDSFTKANIKSTLGISDWALASSKPSYTTKEVAEDTNLYFTNARAVDALKSITDGLQSDIDIKLDASVFSELFEKVTLEDGVTAIRAKYGLFTDYFLSAKGANTNGGSSSGGGLITSLYRYADLGKTFADTNNDTFNAYTINKINTDLGSRISVLEGKATNVSFTQSLTSGTQIGSISIDGVAKNIYAPTIPTNLSQFTDDVVSGKYLPLSGGEVGSLLISSASNTPLTIKTTSAYAWSGICFLNNNGVSVGNIGIDNNRPIFVPKELNDIMYILHSGNYTDYTYSQSTIDTKLGGYLPLSGGTIAGDLQIDKGTDVYTSLRIGKNGVGREIVIHNTGGLGGLTTRSAVLSLYNNGTMISGIGLLESEPIYVKADSNIQFLIHSGNIGSQSVASADKLTTARSLWGQSFDGTGDINGGIIAKSIIPTTSWVSDTAQLRANATDTNYYVGMAATNNGYAVIQGGNAGVGAIPLLLNPNGGNLLIGTTTDNGNKLQVSGGISATSAITTSSAITTTFRGGGISGLYPDSWISGANANRLWLYNDYELAIYGSTIELISSVNVYGTLHATTGIWSDGYVSAKGQNTSSDMRLKNVLNEVVLGVKDIANAPSMRFAWKNGGGVDVGSSAQYWQGLLPDAVKERDGMLEMQYANIALLSAIALAKNFETMDERVARLEKENEELRTKIDMMERGIA